jgi:hypothetical protein
VDLVGESTARREAWRRRVLSLAGAVAVAFVALLGQLWYLQVLEGGKLQELSDKNRIRIRPVAAPRGILFDRNGLARPPRAGSTSGQRTITSPSRTPSAASRGPTGRSSPSAWCSAGTATRRSEKSLAKMC